jgi:hypothetical protein
MEILSFALGFTFGATVIFAVFYNRVYRFRVELDRIEKEFTEQYRGETFEKRAKRVSK